MRSLLLFGLAFHTPITAQEVQLESVRTRFRTTAEFLRLQGEDVGLIGLHYDWLEPFEDLSDFYLGLGGYTGVTGGQGGFQAAGITAGFSKEIRHGFLLEAGAFVGGAGGGGELGRHQGLALRIFIALEKALGVLGLRLEVASFDVPETDIEFEDVHLALGLTSASEVLLARERFLDEILPEDAIVERTTRTSVRYVRQHPDTGSRKTNGEPIVADVSLIGVGFDYFLNEHIFLPLQAYGAVGGGLAGYSMALVGAGGSYALDAGERFRLEGTLSVGAGGGGAVDTGGGFLWQAKAALRGRLTKHLGLEVSAARFDFPGGHFEGAEYSAGLTWTAHPLELALPHSRSSLSEFGLSSDDAVVRPLNVSLANKIYLPPSTATLQSGDAISTANLIGVTIERPVYKGFVITGAAYTAWDGNIGGYSEGLLGTKYEFVLPREQHSFHVRGEMGAAGGAGVDVGSGLIYTVSAGYRYRMGKHLFFQAEAGKVEADRGSFEAELWQLGIGWHLGRAFAAD